MDKEKNDALDEKLSKIVEEFSKKQNVWNKDINSLSSKINSELNKLIELSAESISKRQILIEERTKMYYKIYLDLPKIKNSKKKYFEFYSTKYQIKTNSGDKNKLIDADVGYLEAKLDCIENYILFLTESIKTLDHIIWSVKNRIELYNISGLD